MSHAETANPTAGANSGPTGAHLVRDGGLIVPTPLAQGPWGGAISGHVLGGLLGATLERVAGDTAFQPARLTVDLLRPALMEPVEVDAVPVREGGRIRLADATLTQGGKLIGRASAVFLRRGEHPDQQVWSHEAAIPPPPVPMPASLRSPFAVHALGWGPDPNHREVSVPKFAWVRETRPLIDGEVMSPFTRAAMAGDVTSTVVHWGYRRNAVHQHRLHRDAEPAARKRIGGHCCTITPRSERRSHRVATLFDTTGPIGHAMATALADSRFSSPFAG